MSTEMRRFLSANHYAVIGASADRTKWANKVLRWYTAHDLPVTPVNPNAEAVEGIPTAADASRLDDLPHTSISIIINPTAGLPILQKLFNRPSSEWPRAIWLQPGAFDRPIQEYLASKGAAERVVPYGECILVKGDSVLHDLQRSPL